MSLNKHFIGNLTVHRAKFKFSNTLFDGKGFINWNEEEGLLLLLHVFSDDYKQPQVFGLGAPRLKKSNERVNLYLRQDNRLVIIPRVHLGDGFTINHDRTLKLKTDYVTIFEPLLTKETRKRKSWEGEAEFIIDQSEVVWPDVVKTEEKLGSATNKNWSRSGFYFSDDLTSIVGKIKNEKILSVKYKFNKNKYSKNFVFNFPKGLKYALSFLLGCEVMITSNKFETRNSIVRELYKKKDPILMNLFRGLSPNQFITSELIFQLSKYFTGAFILQKKQTSVIGRKIVQQVIESEKQSSFLAQELLIATILEAFIRTLLNKPYSDSGKSLPIKNILLSKDFKIILGLDKQWKELLENVVSAHSRTRNRNAHPDWINSEEYYSDEKLSDTYYDLCILLNFYQLMILKMAGIEGVEPTLPDRLT